MKAAPMGDAARRSSRHQEASPPAEEVVPEFDMEEEEVPTVDFEAAARAREDAMKKGEMRARVSWILVLAMYLAFPGFQRDMLDEMGFGEVLRMEWMRADAPLTQALRLPSLLFATRGDPIHCRFLPLLEDLGQVGSYAWGAAFLAHQFENLDSSDRQTAISGFYPFLHVWAYLHLPGLRRGILERPGIVPIARHWVPCRDTHPLGDQLASLQDAIDLYPQLDPYQGEADEGQPRLELARPYFGRTVWIQALNLVLPLHHYLTQRSLSLHQSEVEFPSHDWTPRPGRRFRGLHDNTEWRERAKEQIQNWERRGKQVKSTATSDDAYLQAFALKYGARFWNELQVDVAGKIALLRALFHSVVQDQERAELERVRRAQTGASSSRVAEGSQSDLEDRLAAAVKRAEESQAELAEWETELRTATDRAAELQREVDRVEAERDQLRTQTDAMTAELVRLRTQGPVVD
ncbi:hypothetical protein Taro_015778 [Colocasia esculenta]|uniref:Aminotransferase-like plant mobile domain-containing protein n=1 Tax=Colocasia esculenta TaxID=4460 RepID=A0A843UC73_COLES|nr:hypothetical protein [Colocasia esculenta]